MASSSPFLGLPLEVKTLIYECLLTCDEYRINPQPDGTNPPTQPHLHPQVLSTCKQVNTEATHILYERNPWILISFETATPEILEDLPVPRLPIPGPIGKRLQSPLRPLGLILPVQVVERDRFDVNQEDPAGRRRTVEFMIDLRNFCRLCRFSLDNFELSDKYVTLAFDLSSAHREKGIDFYNKVLGGLGEADGNNYVQNEPYPTSDGEVEDGEDVSSDFSLSPTGCYSDLEVLLERMSHYEEEACRRERKGELHAAQCLRLDCLELAQYGAKRWYVPEIGMVMAKRGQMERLLDRIMSVAILCATSSLETGNTKIVSCVQAKVKSITEGEGRYWHDDYEFKLTEDYKVIMEQCFWRIFRDQHMRAPATVQEIQIMAEFEFHALDGVDPWEALHRILDPLPA